MKTPYWLLAGCFAAIVPLQASATFKPIEVQDQELAQLRGRYVMPGRIISFGVVMSTSWQNASGDVIGATTTMQVQQTTIKPQFYVSLVNTTGNGTPTSTGTGTVTGGAGLSTTQGVTQSIRAAGDNNSAYNNVSINVSESNNPPASSTPQGQLLTGGTPITGANAAGNLSVSVNSGGVLLNIQANNNQGNTLQQIAQGGVMQNTTLLGASNMVNNMTQLNVVLRNNMPTVGALDCNLDQLKGLRNIGY